MDIIYLGIVFTLFVVTLGLVAAIKRLGNGT